MQNEIQKTTYSETLLNDKGDIQKQSFFMDSDSDGVLFNKFMEKHFTISRNELTGIPVNEIIITNYLKEEEVIESSEQILHFSLQQGMEINQESRNRLIMKSQDEFFKSLLSEYTPEESLNFGKQLIDDTTSERAKYILGTIQPLIDVILTYNAPFMTEDRKTMLILILDIKF